MIEPGSTIGILGSGQLGRMLAIAGRHLGYRFHVYSPDADSPAHSVVDKAWVGGYNDSQLLAQFGDAVDVVTFEFENVSAAAAEILREHTNVRPSGKVLAICQDRIKEKSFIQNLDIPVPSFREVNSLEALLTSADDLGCPFVLKSTRMGYDGKGQTKVVSRDDCHRAWELLKAGSPCIAEAFVDYEREASLIIARNPSGDLTTYPVFENDHCERHILDVTSVPARISSEQQQVIDRIGDTLATALDLEGLLTVELFVLKDGSIAVNELAPRVHNSGHLTIEGSPVSQFEQQIRAICDLPLVGATIALPIAMSNLLGDLWEGGTPAIEPVLANERAALHLYGKHSARAGRKMGHITVIGESAETAAREARELRDRFDSRSVS